MKAHFNHLSAFWDRVLFGGEDLTAPGSKPKLTLKGKRNNTMIIIDFNMPSGFDDNALCECDNCDKTFEAWELLGVDNPHKTLRAGDIVPAGQCPECDGLVYLIDGLAYLIDGGVKP